MSSSVRIQLPHVSKSAISGSSCVENHRSRAQSKLSSLALAGGNPANMDWSDCLHDGRGAFNTMESKRARPRALAGIRRFGTPDCDNGGGGEVESPPPVNQRSSQDGQPR